MIRYLFLLLVMGFCVFYSPTIKSQSEQSKNNARDSLFRLSKEKATDSLPLISIYRELGTHYFYRSLLDSASFFYIKSTKIAEVLQNNAELVKSYGSLANVYDLLRDASTAQSYRKKAYLMAQKSNNVRQQIKICFNMSVSYFNENKIDSATIFAQKAVQMSREKGFHIGEYRSLAKLSACYLKNNAHQKALQTIEEAIQIPKDKIDPSYELNVLKTYSNILKANQRYEQAKKNIQQSIRLLQYQKPNAVTKVNLQDNYFLLSSVYTYLNQSDSASFYMEKAIHLNHEIEVDKIVKATAKIQAQYETEKKEQRIKDLEQETKIKDLELKNSYYFLATGTAWAFLALLAVWLFFRQKSIIEEYEKRQAKLRWRRAQLNPHFFFNVLSALQTLMYEKRNEEAIEYASGFSILMRKVLEESNQEKVSLQEEIDFLTNYLALEQLSLDFEYKITCTPEDLETEDILIPTMILQPFIENAVEHGLRKSTKSKKIIHISIIEKSRDTLQISVRDNGAGRSKEQHKNHISRALEITNDRKKLMKGAFNYQIIDHKDKHQNSLGTEVVFTLSI